MKRSAGVLLSISSLPSKYGIGCFSESAYKFVDWLKAAGQTYWQILPLGPTGYGDSPYQSFSTFAGNPYFISLEEWVKDGLLTQKECDETDMGKEPACVDYEKLYKGRFPLFHKAYKRSNISQKPEFIRFCRENEEWLSDYALFMAVKDSFKGVAWNEWDEDIRLRQKDALKQFRKELAEEIEFYQFLQFYFYKQWTELKRYANEKGIKIIGDIPIYVAFDSADTWANPSLFQLDENNIPKAVAGCPPDGFSADGQVWGNPLYNWEQLENRGYAWWIERLKHCFKLYDVVRIDHFRGFDEYFSIPYGDTTALNGHWEKGPGMKLFDAMKACLGNKDIIAEDLGFMTESVKELVKNSGFANMKVLEFGFDSRDTGNREDYLPHNYGENCVAYTGTHDNQTVRSWFETISDEERNMVKEYLEDEPESSREICRAFIELVMKSKANVCIIPMQDYLGYDDTTRMNQPSTVGKNWRWRMVDTDLSDTLKEEIICYTRKYVR